MFMIQPQIKGVGLVEVVLSGAASRVARLRQFTRGTR